jgi:hypothetical protein
LLVFFAKNNVKKRKPVIPTFGCKYCGARFDETPGLHTAAHISRCCQKCWLKLFATDAERTEYAEDKETKLVAPKPKPPQRIEADKVTLKKVIWE